MKRRIRFSLAFTIFFILMLAMTTVVLAQSKGLIRIDLISTVESEESVELKVYFNLYDPTTGAPMTQPKPEKAEITLLTTNHTTPASIQTPDLPIYITLVLDASGSMAANAQKLRDAAKLALTNPPDDAYFGVVQFDEGITLLQDFTDNLQLVNYAIDQYKTSFGGTCLYDAAFQAVEAQAQAPIGRRAVILFTDGMDEGKDGKPCSEKSYEELTTRALELKVPIHTVGLVSSSGKINETELRNMAGTTGGYSAIASVDQLPAAFSKIMDALKTQLVLTSTIYPQEGQNQAVFTLTFDDESILNTAFFIDSETDYPGPPSPVTMRFDGLQLIAETQTYEMQLSLTSPELVGYVKVALWDTNSGSKMNDYQFNDPQEFNTFNLPTDQLTATHKYELRISAISREDGTAFALPGEKEGEQVTELLHEFTFDPSSFYPSAVIDSVSQEGSELILNISMTNPGMIGGFDGWLVNEATKTQVKGSNFSVSAESASGGQILLPTRESRLESGKYTVVLRVLNAQNEVMTTTEYSGVTYNAPGLTERLVAALTAKPIFLAIIAGIIMLVVVFFMFTSARQKSMSSTPVMQGQLGKKMKGKELSDGLQAIASDEGVLLKHTPSTSTPRVPSSPATTPKASPPVDATVMYNTLDAAPSRPEPVRRQPVQSYLVVVKGIAPGSHLIDQNPYTIGRTEGNLVIGEGSVSRRHAQISSDASQNFFITDLNSSNGTRVNGRRLTGGETVQITNGAVIEIGANVTLKFEKK